MQFSEMFPSKYFKADDLVHGEVECVIDRVEFQDMTNNGDTKPVLYFRGQKKGLVLNLTNGRTIKSRYGDESDSWEGKTVILYRTEISFQGKDVPSIRVRIPVEDVEDERPF